MRREEEKPLAASIELELSIYFSIFVLDSTKEVTDALALLSEFRWRRGEERREEKTVQRGTVAVAVAVSLIRERKERKGNYLLTFSTVEPWNHITYHIYLFSVKILELGIRGSASADPYSLRYLSFNYKKKKKNDPDLISAQSIFQINL